MRFLVLTFVALLAGPAMADEIDDVLRQPDPMQGIIDSVSKPAPIYTTTMPPVESIYEGVPPYPTTTTCITIAGVLICTTR